MGCRRHHLQLDIQGQSRAAGGLSSLGPNAIALLSRKPGDAENVSLSYWDTLYGHIHHSIDVHKLESAHASVAGYHIQPLSASTLAVVLPVQTGPDASACECHVYLVSHSVPKVSLMTAVQAERDTAQWLRSPATEDTNNNAQSTPEGYIALKPVRTPASVCRIQVDSPALLGRGCVWRECSVWQVARASQRRGAA